jgi:hypothetical protein
MFSLSPALVGLEEHPIRDSTLDTVMNTIITNLRHEGKSDYETGKKMDFDGCCLSCW